MVSVKSLVKSQKGTSILMGLFMTLAAIMMLALIIDGLYLSYSYFYIKTQMDIANKAVYKELDINELAYRRIYIDEAAGYDTFIEYLKKNLKLSDQLNPTANTKLRIASEVTIQSFIIYNEGDLPAVTPVGTNIDQVAVHSRIELKVRPIFISWFGDVSISPYVDTDLPDKLIKNYHP